jgi:hypothetical protein
LHGASLVGAGPGRHLDVAGITRSRRIIEGLAADLEPFDLWPTAPEPPGTATRGWYVDAASF